MVEETQLAFPKGNVKSHHLNRDDRRSGTLHKRLLITLLSSLEQGSKATGVIGWILANNKRCPK